MNIIDFIKENIDKKIDPNEVVNNLQGLLTRHTESFKYHSTKINSQGDCKYSVRLADHASAKTADKWVNLAKCMRTLVKDDVETSSKFMKVFHETFNAYFSDVYLDDKGNFTLYITEKPEVD
ncbi:MAG: hypothetical protein SPK55_09925 [Succinivibrio sp.]|jgi:hypothetical protein|nr:hypothetical protein [Succinivibrio sp.]